LNTDKINVIKCNLNYLQEDQFQAFYKAKIIKDVTNIKFLGLGIKHLDCKIHVKQIIPKLSCACYAVRFDTSVMQTQLK
jgi:hypothetical protein